MGKGIVKLGEGQWAVKDGNLLAAKETNGRFKNAEFTVDRGSDATYVGRDGLIKNTSSNIESEVFLNPTFDATIPLGSSGSGWSDSGLGEVTFYDGGLKITGEGVGTAKARARDASLSSAILETSRLYELTYTIKSISSKNNTFSLYMAGNTHTITQKSVGTHTILVASGTNANKIFQFQWTQSDNESIVFSSVSLKESLVANGTFDTDSNWSFYNADADTNTRFENNSATLEVINTQFTRFISTTSPMTVDKFYKITYEVTETDDTDLSIQYPATTINSSIGTHTVYIKATNVNIGFSKNNVGKIIIDNVSIFEIDNGALPRIDFTNNTDGHLLLELQSTNLITYSEDFEQSVWTKNSGVTLESNYGISPDGSKNSTKVTFANPNLEMSYTVTTGDETTGSMYVKGVEGETIKFGTKLSEEVFTLNGSWQRFEKTGSVETNNKITINTYSGATAREIEVWGAQLEELSYATSYIPTNGSTVTKDAETVQRVSIDEIDIPQEEGTIYLELKGYEKNTEIFNFNRSTSNSIHVFTDSAGALKVQGFYEPEGTDTAASVTLNNNISKVAIAFKNGSFIVYADGEEELNTSTFVWTPTTSINKIYFNQGGYVAQRGLSKVKALKIYKEAFNTTQLDELTS
jgi:hypothetical protein